MADPTLVVGGGMAGHAAAAALGEAGAEVVLADAAPHAPYDRPPLSKKLLVGAVSADDLVLKDKSWWADHGVELRLGQRIVEVDPVAHTARTDGGAEIAWSSLVLATGGTPRRLPIPGVDLPGVVEVNDLDGSEACRAVLADAEHVVVVGAGFIGCEAAAAIRETGRSVTVIEAMQRPLVAAIGSTVAGWLLETHAAAGVRMTLGTGCTAFEGDDRVRRVRSGDATFDADVVISAVGIRLNLDLASSMGCAVNTGVVVDAEMRTSVPDVYAVGDIAEWPCRYVAPPGEPAAPYRAEHYNVALGHGAAAASAILGADQPYDDLPTFWTDQYDLTINVAGAPELADEAVVRGSPDVHDFLALYFRGEQLIAGLGVGARREYRAARRMLDAQAPLTPSHLTDPDRTLAELAKELL